jgi:hypothetical protein
MPLPIPVESDSETMRFAVKKVPGQQCYCLRACLFTFCLLLPRFSTLPAFPSILFLSLFSSTITVTVITANRHHYQPHPITIKVPNQYHRH